MTATATAAPLAALDRAARDPRFELRASDLQASAKLDESTLVIGHMADGAGVPLGRLSAEDRLRVADATLAGDRSTPGGWTLVARRGDDVLVRTDLFGTRPLFWRHSVDRTEVGEDIWPLARSARIDPHGLADMLLVGHHIGTGTLFEGVQCSIGNALVRLGGTVEERYFDWPPPAVTGPSLAEAAAAIEAALDGLFQPFADLDGLLVLLSGGLDSRTLLALAVDHGLPVRAWTMVMRPGTQEERIARTVARRLGVELSVTRAGPSELAGLAPDMVRATSGQLSLEHAHVFGPHLSAPTTYSTSANGIGGDLLCGASFLGAPGLDSVAARAERVRQLVGGADVDRLQPRLPGVPDWSQRLRETVAQRLARAGDDPRRRDLVVVTDRPSRFNVWGSIAMRPRLDYIAPFFEQRLMETMYGMPEEWRRDSRAYKLAIARRWPQLATIPWAKTGLPLIGGRPRMLGHRVRGRLRRRPRTFTDSAVYWDAFGRMADDAVAELGPPLARMGIDLAGLCADHPVETGFGRALRLRAATCLLTFRQAGSRLD